MRKVIVAINFTSLIAGTDHLDSEAYVNNIDYKLMSIGISSGVANFFPARENKWNVEVNK